VLKQRDSRGLRYRAIVALAKLGDHRVLDALIQALDDRDPSVRESAAVTLDHIGGLRSLGSLLNDLDDEARREPGRFDPVMIGTLDMLDLELMHIGKNTPEDVRTLVLLAGLRWAARYLRKLQEGENEGNVKAE
jgi:HEAT repeat protein